MRLKKNLITASLFAAAAPLAFADENAVQAQRLDTIQVQVHPLAQTAADFAAADHIVSQQQLAERPATIGDALAGELGVSSNQYGAGSSRQIGRAHV